MVAGTEIKLQELRDKIVKECGKKRLSINFKTDYKLNSKCKSKL